jgi:hypothetical protein
MAQLAFPVRLTSGRVPFLDESRQVSSRAREPVAGYGRPRPTLINHSDSLYPLSGASAWSPVCPMSGPMRGPPAREVPLSAR